MIPVTAEDVQRERRRTLLKWLGAGLVVLLVGGIIYKRINDPRQARESFDAGMRFIVNREIAVLLRGTSDVLATGMLQSLLGA